MVVRARHGSSIGQPLTRREGLLKVTGAARFSADNHPPGMLYAALAVSAVAHGRVAFLDVAAAKRHSGVVEVMTPANKPALQQHPDKKNHARAFALDLLQDDRVRYVNQPIAVVIAESLEAATEAAWLLIPRYEVEAARTSLDLEPRFVPPAVGSTGEKPEAGFGDTGAALRSAARRVDVCFATPPQYHNPIEPHAIMASWDGDTLTLDTPSQGMTMAKARIAELFGIDPEDILIRSPYLGGGFGSKAFISGPQVLGIMAARLVGRPVKLVVQREHMYGPVGHRAGTKQALHIGAEMDGALTALEHHTLTSTSSFDCFFEASCGVSHVLYATPALRTSYQAVRLDTGTPTFMRAPGEASGSVALESAMDELAEACGMDPLAFRLRNYAENEPLSGKPFSSKALRECYQMGAARFGWASRPLAPRSMRDGSGLLTGWGVGTATYPAKMFQAEAHARINANGRGTMEIGAQDMGQGAWTALAQIAADGLGLDMDSLDFRSGRSDLPNGGIAGGAAHTATAGNAVHSAAGAAVAKLAEIATRDPASPLFGAGNTGFVARNGHLWRLGDESRGESYAGILARAGLSSVEAKGASAPGPTRSDYALHAHGAVFAEVKVDPELCQVRVSRLVGAFAAGRVINPRLVESQYFGGMVWGLSFALLEEAVTDGRTGRPMNGNLADYHIAVNADVPAMEAILVEEHDPHVNELGVKGVGEIAITGTAGAIVNAVWHATGVRVRSTPITPEKLIGK